MDTELHRLLGEVERYLKKSGVPASTFGLSVVNDRAMVLRMRRGKAITSKNMSLIRAFMAENKHLRKPKNPKNKEMRSYGKIDPVIAEGR